MISLTIGRLREQLFAWYSKRRAEGVPPDFTAMENLSIANLGSRSSQRFKSKAAECKTIVPFIVEELRRHVDEVHCGAELLAAGQAMLQFIKLMKDSPAVPTTGDCQASGQRCGMPWKASKGGQGGGM